MLPVSPMKIDAGLKLKTRKPEDRPAERCHAEGEQDVAASEGEDQVGGRRRRRRRPPQVHRAHR